MQKGIPLAVLKPLTDKWKSDDDTLSKFSYYLDFHKAADLRSGLTSRCFLSEIVMSDMEAAFTRKEFAAIIKSGVVPSEFYNEKEDAGGSIGVNQHYLNSLEEFYAKCQKEWDLHVERTNAIIGTPAGRIWRPDHRKETQ